MEVEVGSQSIRPVFWRRCSPPPKSTGTNGTKAPHSIIKLKRVDFRFDGRDLRGLEQNTDTKSRRAKLAREGEKVVQLLENGRYLGVVDGKLHLYPSKD